MPAQSVRRLRTSAGADVFFYLVLAITAANFSFLTFAPSGGDLVHSTLKPLAYARLPLVVMGFFYLMSRPGLSVDQLLRSYPLILLLLGCVPLSLVMSPDPVVALIYGSWFVFTVLFIVAYKEYLLVRMGPEHALRKFASALMALSAYVLVLGLIALPSFRLGKPFPAFYSSYIVLAMIAPLYLACFAIMWDRLKSVPLVKYAALSLLLFDLLVIAAGGKRASIVCAIIIMGGYFLIRMKWASKVGALILLPVLLYVPTMSQDVSNLALEVTEHSRFRIEKGLNERTRTSIQGRFYVWEEAINEAVNYPLGVGLNVGIQVVGVGLHNSYLGYLLELGWLAGVFLLIIMLVTVIKGLKSVDKTRQEMFFFMFLPSALYSMTEYNTAPGQLLFLPFWLSIVFILGPSRRG